MYLETRHIKDNIDCSQLYYILPVGGIDFIAKLISKMELLLPKLVGEDTTGYYYAAMSKAILVLSLWHSGETLKLYP